MRQILFFLPILFPVFSFAGPAVLFEEVEVPSKATSPRSLLRKQSSPETEIRPLSQRTTLRNIYENQEFDSVSELKAKRRMGIGATALGPSGLYGTMLELNFTPLSSAILGFGGGPGFNSFHFQWKSLLADRTFAPYIGLGYARWYNSADNGGGVGHTSPNYLGSQFLSDDEKRKGSFSVNLVTPSLGIQFTQLSGGATGAAVFAEINLLTEIESATAVPAGALGAIYYF